MQHKEINPSVTFLNFFLAKDHKETEPPTEFKYQPVRYSFHLTTKHCW